MPLPLLASILALAVGPVLFSRSRGGWAGPLLDGFSLIAVGGLVAVQILPQSFALAGWLVLPLVVLGFLGPGLLCGTNLLTGRIAIPLALTGIGLHALLDGVALVPEDGATGHEARTLALAVVLHRIPIGLGLWWLARPVYGRRATWLLLLFIAIASVVGYLFGETLLQGASGSWVALFQAFVAGSLLHVILKHPPRVPGNGTAGTARWASGVGGLLGIGLIVGLQVLEVSVPAAHGGHELAAAHAGHGAAHGIGAEAEREALGAFRALALQSAPALLLAYLAVAFVHLWMVDIRAFLSRGGRIGQTLRGTFSGLPLPICSCGVIPLYRSLVQERVPTPAAMSFLVATPEIGFAALFLSWELLGGEVTFARIGSAVVLALVIGLTVGRRTPVLVAPGVPQNAPARTAGPRRLLEGLRYGLGDMVDSTGPWILVGIALAAALTPVIDPHAFEALPRGLEVPLFALIGMPLYVCASGSTPLVAVLIAKGISPGAAIAFLLTGPATNVTTFGVLGKLHGKRTAVAFAAAVVLLTIALGYAVNALIGTVGTAAPAPVHEHGGTPLQIVSLVALAALFVVSFLRQGARGFVGQVISAHGHEHDHEHEDGTDGETGAPAGGCCSAPEGDAAHSHSAHSA